MGLCETRNPYDAPCTIRQPSIHKHTPTSGYNHADGGGPCSLHEVQEQRAQQVSDWLQLLDGRDPQGHGAVLCLFLYPEVKQQLENNERELINSCG